MDDSARLLRGATPLLAKQISSKYSHSSSLSVQRDLSENHCRHLSKDYIQNLAQDVGTEIVKKESEIIYSLPSKVSDCQVVSIGRDGTTSYVSKDGYRETMNGTISFYNQEKQRVHTIYLAQAPEYGKANFNARFSAEIHRIKSLMNNHKTTYVALADGALDNWSFLDQHTEVAILDYWHATEYLAQASKAASKSAYEKKQWLEAARSKLKNEEGAVESILKEIKGFKRKRNLSELAKTELQKAITYFTNHQHQMKYAEYSASNYPIGSGVTEAACKVIVKQRICQSGMKWTINGMQKTLNIRTLHQTNGRWTQFWKHIDKFGLSPN